MLIDERNEITKRFQAENERIIQTLNFEKNEMMNPPEEEGQESERVISDKDQDKKSEDSD